MPSQIRYRLLTVSVDDGHPTDLHVAEILARCGLNATFYVPARNPEREVISLGQVRDLATRFEIGSHTVNHVDLTTLSRAAAWEEIKGSQQWVEDTTSAPAMAFCYPRGKHNTCLAAMVKAAGFSGARTTMVNLTGIPKDPFRWGVSTQAYSHSSAIQIRHALIEGNFAGLMACASTFRFATQWDKHLWMAVDYVQKCGGVVHLFLHGWEIAELDQWGRLERVLDDLANRKELTCVTNGDLFSTWQALRDNKPFSPLNALSHACQSCTCGRPVHGAECAQTGTMDVRTPRWP
jgi:peptidoglycan/xylan/chitin deacetylase (PgdA/CDA1 family)